MSPSQNNKNRRPTPDDSASIDAQLNWAEAMVKQKQVTPELKLTMTNLVTQQQLETRQQKDRATAILQQMSAQQRAIMYETVSSQRRKKIKVTLATHTAPAQPQPPSEPPQPRTVEAMARAAAARNRNNVPEETSDNEGYYIDPVRPSTLYSELEVRFKRETHREMGNYNTVHSACAAISSASKSDVPPREREQKVHAAMNQIHISPEEDPEPVEQTVIRILRSIVEKRGLIEPETCEEDNFDNA